MTVTEEIEQLCDYLSKTWIYITEREHNSFLEGVIKGFSMAHTKDTQIAEDCLFLSNLIGELYNNFATDKEVNKFLGLSK